MMKTLLLNPPSYEDFDGGAGSRYQARREVRSFWYPTWLCYPAGLIPKSRVLDAPAADVGVDETVRIAQDYDLVVVYTSTPSLQQDARTAERIKAVNPRALIGFVGPHPTVLPEETLRASPAIDFVARLEFDHSVPEIAEGRDLDEVDGISYRRPDGRIVHTKARPPLEDLDALPFVTPIYRRDLNMHHYDSGYILHPYVSFYTGRGCASRCTFCLWPQTFSGHAYRVRSVENIVEEVRLALKLFPEAKEIFFDDDTLTDNRPQVRELARRFKQLGFTWSANSRVTTDYETLKVMREGGLRLLVVGYESGDDQILRNIRKGATVKMAREFTRNCKRLGIMIHGTFIVGLPGETRQTIEETIAFAKELDVDSLQVSLASPYPGTHMYDVVTQNGFVSAQSLVSHDGYQSAAIEYPWLSSQELADAVERFYREFYYRPKVVARILGRALFDADQRRRLIRQGAEFRQAMKRRRETARAGAV